MNIEFKISVPEEEHESLIPFTNALQRDSFLFELFSNFFRRYKHMEDEEYQRIAYEVIDAIHELAGEYHVVKP